MTTAETTSDHFKSTWLATALGCVGIVATGLLFENSMFSLSIAAVLCISLLFYGTSVCGSCITTAKLLLFNSGLFVFIFVLLRVTLNNVTWRFPHESWPGLHRISRVWWLSGCSAIILALIGVGVVATEVARKIGDDANGKRFQWSMIAATSVLVAVNTVHFLRPVWCADCFFPYGPPFTLFTEGGYGGGGGFVWPGFLADAALIPVFAAVFTVIWDRVAA